LTPALFIAAWLLVSEPNPPFEMEVAGKPAGLAVDLVNAAMELAGEPVDVKLFPWARCIEMVKGKDADGIFYIYQTPERDEFLAFPGEPLFDNAMTLYAKKGHKIAFDGDLGKLAKLRIGVVSTKSYGPDFDRAKVQVPLLVEPADDLPLSFKKLQKGRIDLVISNRISAQWTLKEMGLVGEFDELKPFVQVSPAFLAFSKAKGGAASEARAKRVEKALEALKKSPRYGEIFRKYGLEL